MKSKTLNLSALGMLAIALGGCADGPLEGGAGGTGPRQSVEDAVLGVSLSYPEGWSLARDPYLFETYGFTLLEPDADPADSHGGRPVARVALVHGAAAADLDALVRAERDDFPDVPMTTSEVQVGGHRGVAVGPVPGIEPATAVFVAVDGRVYKIRHRGERLDDAAREFLSGVRFSRPTRTVGSLDLPSAASDVARYGGPVQPASEARGPLADPESGRGGLPFVTALAEEALLSNGCYTQPTWLFIQTQHASDANGTGYSWTGGAGSFWGQGGHQGCTNATSTNDYYAIDYPLQTGNKLYGPFDGGYVQYAGWDSEGWSGYGRMVVIKHRDGKYWSLAAHMNSISVSVGQYVDQNTVIGYAGSTGNSSGPHLHQAFYRFPGSSAGRPYGGRGVKQTAMRYYRNGGGTYTSFWDGMQVSW
ncbi:MAG TPA: M23 family metallopeptidase [Longimicrobiaceae bacterium]|nr:M23 family metallopeptidase [Longimicrobiaceae bacterium]